MTTVKSRNNAQAKASLPFNGIQTEVTLVARRGAVMYGVCLTPRNSIALVELMEVERGFFERTDIKVIHFNELRRMTEIVKNDIRATVSCFVGNMHLDEQQTADLKARLEAKVHELIAQIPAPEVYPF